MVLDQNLFTLTLAPSTSEQGSTDLTDQNGMMHYRKRRHATEASTYSWSLYDPLCDGLLASVNSPTASSKQKSIELHNPSVVTELKYTGSIQFKWNFDWEDHTYEWKRDTCYILRKPDPPVLICVTEQDKRNKANVVLQLLDYNLNRFDINDRKGLEIVLLCAFLTFQDHSDDHKSPRQGEQRRQSSGSTPRVASDSGPSAPTIAPPVPPKEENSIRHLQAVEHSEPNEVMVSDEGDVAKYAHYCYNLLMDDSILFITLRAKFAEHVSKVVAVAEQTKMMLHREGADEVHQYVRYDEIKEAPGKKGPRIIKLDGPPEPQTQKPADYKPPTTLTLHLSKIPMPELAPRTSNLKPSSSYRPAPPPNSGSSSSGGRGPYPPAPTKPQGKQGKPAKRKDTPSPNRTSGGKLHKGANTNAHGQTHSGGGAITASQAWSNYQPPAPAHPPSSSPNSAPHFPMPYNSKQQTHAAVPPATTYNYNQHHPLTPSAQLPAHTPPAHHTPGAGAGALNSGSGTHTPGKPPMTLGLGQLGMNTAMGLLDKLSLRGGQGRGKP